MSGVDQAMIDLAKVGAEVHGADRPGGCVVTVVRISLPAEPTLVAAVLAAVARATNGPCEVYASRDGAELAVEPLDTEPRAVSTPGAGELVPPGEPAPDDLADPPPPGGRPVEPVVPAGSGAATRQCAECGTPFEPVRSTSRHCSAKCKKREANRKYRTKKYGPSRRPLPVAPAREKPEKPIVVEPVPAVEPEPLQPAAGPKANPLAVAKPSIECEHCGTPFTSKADLRGHIAAAHPIKSGKPAHVPPPEGLHQVQHHGSRKWSA